MKTLSLAFSAVALLLAAPASAEEAPTKHTVTRSRPADSLLAGAPSLGSIQASPGGAASGEPQLAIELGGPEETPTKLTVSRSRLPTGSLVEASAATPEWRNTGSKPVLWRPPLGAP